MTILRFLPLLTMTLFGAATPASAPNDEQAVVAVVQRCYQSLSMRDFLELRQCFWPQAIITTYWKRSPKAMAPEVYAQYLEEFIVNATKSLDEFSSFSQTSLSHEIKIYDNVAQVWSVYQMKFTTAEGRSATWRGIDMFHFMRHEDQWRIVAWTYTKESPSHLLIDRGKPR